MNPETVVENIRKAIADRAEYRVNVELLKKCGLHKVIVAGNSLNALSPHDIDLYPFNTGDFANIKFEEVEGCKVLCTSKNATTVSYGGTVYQFCNYHMCDLEHLVDSFDFAHVQVGAVIDVDKCGFVESVYFSDEYVSAQFSGNSRYTHSNYPLSSIIRTLKYYKYEQISKLNAKTSIVTALTDFIKRGFEDYPDFKDQLDAIDLLLLKEIDTGVAKSLYNACCDVGLVRKPNTLDDDKEN